MRPARVCAGCPTRAARSSSSPRRWAGSAPRRSVYCATKHAVEGLRARWPSSSPRRVRVVSVAPTFVATDMTAPFLADPEFRDVVRHPARAAGDRRGGRRRGAVRRLAGGGLDDRMRRLLVDGVDRAVTEPSVRLTTGQASLARRAVVGARRRATARDPAMFGIFGHGNVLGLGQALAQEGAELPLYQPKNEQAMVTRRSATSARRLQTLACTASIPGATNMLRAPPPRPSTGFRCCCCRPTPSRRVGPGRCSSSSSTRPPATCR